MLSWNRYIHCNEEDDSVSSFQLFICGFAAVTFSKSLSPTWCCKEKVSGNWPCLEKCWFSSRSFVIKTHKYKESYRAYIMVLRAGHLYLNILGFMCLDHLTWFMLCIENLAYIWVYLVYAFKNVIFLCDLIDKGKEINHGEESVLYL
jgi:hypothetical protein